MNDYITFDTCRYATTRVWRPEPNVPVTIRNNLNGTLDATYGSATSLIWVGEIVARVTDTRAYYGTVTDLRASLKKRQTFTFIDHYGTSYTVAAQGPFPERSLMPDWDNANNRIYVTIRFIAMVTS
jgi:hypothetical protein